MAEIENLIQSNQLKTNYLAEVAKKKQQPVIQYDGDFDALFITFKPDTKQEIVAYYVDDHVALLYMGDSLEIVGLQIEDFRLSFLPAHENVARIWRLSETGEKVNDMGDIIFYARRLSKVAQAVAQAAKDVLGEAGNELIAALEDVTAA